MAVYLYDNKRHLICYPYNREKLHKMALALRIKRCWFHSKPAKKIGDQDMSHYDIPKNRIAEIAAKCVKVSTKDIIRVMKTGSYYAMDAKKY